MARRRALEALALAFAGACSGSSARAPACMDTYTGSGLPLDGGKPVALASSATGNLTSCVHGIAVNASDVYFTTDGSVSMVPLAGGDSVVLAAAPDCNGSIVVVGSTLYWVNPCSDVTATDAAVSTLPATGTVTPLDPRALAGDAIAADAAAVYWAAQGNLTRYEAATGALAVLAPTDTVFGIAVDNANVYWTTATELRRVPIAGGTASVLATIPGPAAVAVDATNVYVAGGSVCPAQAFAKP